MNNKEKINKKKVNFKLFKENIIKESAYILGLLWADGHILINKKLTTINCVENDLKEVENVFLKTGDWLISEPIKKVYNGEEVKTQKKISTTTWGLFEILKENDYITKSFSSPNKILSIIPPELKKYWYRGYLDGDGCIKLGKKYGVEVVFAGTYEQDWSFIVNLCNELNIDYSIDRRIVKKGKYSHFRVNKKNDVKVLLDFIYSEYSNIGFSRKFKKYQEVIKYIKDKEIKYWSIDDVNFIKKNYNIIGGKKCAEILGKNLNSVYNKIRLLKTKKEI